MEEMNNVTPEEGNGKMREHYTRIWASCFWIGFIIAMVKGNREEALTKKYLNHSVGTIIVLAGCGVVLVIPLIGWVLGCIGMIYCLVINVIMIIKATKDEDINFWPFNKFNIIK